MSDQKITIAIGGKLDASLTSAVNSAESMLDRLNGGSGKSGISKVFSGIGQTIATTGKAALATWASGIAGVTALSKAGINTYMDYEAAFSDVAATAGIAQGTEQWEQLDTAIQHVGETTNKTAMEAASAAKYMFLAGWDQSEVESGLDTMVKLSSALNSDMGRVSDLMTDSMSAAQIGVEDMQHYADLIAQADSAANYTGTEMMEAIIGSAGTARNAGVAITDLATAAGILADNSTKGAEGGTALNAMLTNMFTATKNGGLTAMRAIGVDAYDAAGQVRPLFDILTDLNGALDSVSDEQRNQSMYKIFGKSWESQGKYLLESVRAAEDGTTAYQELNSTLTNAYMGVDQFGDSLSVMNDRYDVMTNNLKGDKDLLDSATDSFLMSVGKSMNAELRELTQETTKLMQDFTKAFKDEGWTGLAEQIGTTLGDISGVFGEKGAEVIKGAGDFVTDLTEEIGGQADDIGTAAAKIVTQLGTSFLGYPDEFVIAGGNLIKGLMDGMIAEGTAEQWASGLTEVIGNIGAWFTKNGTQLGESAGILVTQLATQISAHSGEIVSGGIAIIGGLGKGILTGLPILLSNVPTIVTNLASALVTDAPIALYNAGVGLMSALKDGILYGIDSIKSALDFNQIMQDSMEASLPEADVFDAYNTHIQEFHDIIQQNLGDTVPNSFVQSILDGTTSLTELDAQIQDMDPASMDFADAQEGIMQFQGLVEGAYEQYLQLQQGAEGAAQAQEGLSASTQAMLDSVSGGTADLSGLTESFTAEIESAQATAESAGSAIEDALTIDTSSMDADALSAVINSIDTGNIGELTSAFSSAMTELTTSANTASTSVQTALTTMGTNTQTQVASAVSSMQTSVSADFAIMVSNAYLASSSIYSAFASIDLGGVAMNMMSGLVSGIQSGGAAAIMAAQNIASQIAATMQSALQIHSPSKVMEKIGYYTGAGLGVGIEDSASEVVSATRGLADTAAGSMASNVLTTFASAPAQAPAQGGGIVFSPQITINGNANEADVRSALSWGMEQFRQMYRQLQAEDRRTSFA